MQLLYTTNCCDLQIRDLISQSSEILYDNLSSKSLLQDHYISMVHYLRECEKLFVVSQLRPEKQLQEDERGGAV